MLSECRNEVAVARDNSKVVVNQDYKVKLVLVVKNCNLREVITTATGEVNYTYLLSFGVLQVINFTLRCLHMSDE